MLLEVLTHNFIKQRKTKKEFNLQNLMKLVCKTLLKFFTFLIKWFTNQKKKSFGRPFSLLRWQTFANRFCFTNSNPVKFSRNETLEFWHSWLLSNLRRLLNWKGPGTQPQSSKLFKRFLKIIALVYIYQLTKFGDLISCGSKDTVKSAPCLMY